MLTHSTAYLTIATFTVFGSTVLASSSGEDAIAGPIMGEVRALAVSPMSETAVAHLHQAGWLEARGELLSITEFPDLFETVGRTWTSDIVPSTCFAIPNLVDFDARQSFDNPFGVLGPGDLVTSGRTDHQWAKQAKLSYWVFVGRELTRTGLEKIAHQGHSCLEH
jgi:hypothetical protein